MGAILSNPMTGSVASGIGDLVEGFGAGRAADYQAQIARNNASISRANAEQAVRAGQAAALAQGLRTRDIVGRTKAAQAASGIDVNSGSALTVQQSERILGMMDAMTIRANAARAAYGYESQAAGDVARAAMLKRRGKMERIGGLIGASGTILEGASSVDKQRRLWQETMGRDHHEEPEVPQFGIGLTGDFETRYG